ICLVGDGRETPAAAELLRNADVAMYMAKRDSKGSYRVFEPTMHERVVERLELRSDLQHALNLDQLELHYQPLVRLVGRAIHGVADAGRHRVRLAPAARAEGTRGPSRDGRLRHGILVVELPESLPGRHPQDGPVVRRGG